MNRTLVLSLRETVKVLETKAFILCCCAHVEASLQPREGLYRSALVTVHTEASGPRSI